MLGQNVGVVVREVAEAAELSADADLRRGDLGARTRTKAVWEQWRKCSSRNQEKRSIEGFYLYVHKFILSSCSGFLQVNRNGVNEKVGRGAN